MSRTKERIRSPLAFALLVAAVPLYAQNASPSPAQSPPPVQAAATAAETAGKAGPADGSRGTEQSGARPDQGQAGAVAANKSATPSNKSAAVCFKLTGHCVEGSKGSAAKSGTAASGKDGSATKRSLNLSAPDVRTVVSADELKEPLQTNEQNTETQESETVSVKGDQGVPPDVPGGFGALWWAVNHPSQAWRILAPAE